MMSQNIQQRPSSHPSRSPSLLGKRENKNQINFPLAKKKVTSSNRLINTKSLLKGLFPDPNIRYTLTGSLRFTLRLGGIQQNHPPYIESESVRYLAIENVPSQERIPSKIEVLPVELIDAIFGFLNAADATHFSFVSKKMNEIGKSVFSRFPRKENHFLCRLIKCKQSRETEPFVIEEGSVVSPSNYFPLNRMTPEVISHVQDSTQIISNLDQVLRNPSKKVQTKILQYKQFPFSQISGDLGATPSFDNRISRTEHCLAMRFTTTKLELDVDFEQNAEGTPAKHSPTRSTYFNACIFRLSLVSFEILFKNEGNLYAHADRQIGGYNTWHGLLGVLNSAKAVEMLINSRKEIALPAETRVMCNTLNQAIRCMNETNIENILPVILMNGGAPTGDDNRSSTLRLLERQTIRFRNTFIRLTREHFNKPESPHREWWQNLRDLYGYHDDINA